jgi:hypothetical protein
MAGDGPHVRARRGADSLRSEAVAVTAALSPEGKPHANGARALHGAVLVLPTQGGFLSAVQAYWAEVSDIR